MDDGWAGLKAATFTARSTGSHQQILKIAASFTAVAKHFAASVTRSAKLLVSNAWAIVAKAAVMPAS